MATKEATVSELAGLFRHSTAVWLTEYRGLSVPELKQLRDALRVDASYAVVKNTLTKIAAKEAGIDSLDDLLVGPSALTFVHGDPVAAAKTLRNFAKDHPALVIKGGFFEGQPLEAADVMAFANLESREVLLGKLAGAFKASLFAAAYMFTAPQASAVRAIDQLRQKKETQDA
jgi:large subunit ribosomal protein L10